MLAAVVLAMALFACCSPDRQEETASLNIYVDPAGGGSVTTDPAREWTDLQYKEKPRSTYNGCFTVWFTILKRSSITGKVIIRYQYNVRTGQR